MKKEGEEFHTKKYLVRKKERFIRYEAHCCAYHTIPRPVTCPIQVFEYEPQLAEKKFRPIFPDLNADMPFDLLINQVLTGTKLLVPGTILPIHANFTSNHKTQNKTKTANHEMLLLSDQKYSPCRQCWEGHSPAVSQQRSKRMQQWTNGGSTSRKRSRSNGSTEAAEGVGHERERGSQEEAG